MKVLVFGHRGWIGGQVIELLKKDPEVKDIFWANSRAENVEQVERELVTLKPTHVMSFIGRTHGTIGDKVYGTIDYLEQPGKLVENVRDNLFSPVALSLLCKKYGIHFTYLGTGCIFEQNPVVEENGFTEDSKPNFFGSGYSIVKGFTDQLMHVVENTLNVRIRMPITAEKISRNFITKITNYPKICSIPNSMTVLPNLLPLMIDMAKKGKTGTVNLVNPGLISHNEILQMYKEIVDPTFKWQNFSLEEQSKILAAGRSNNYLATDYLEGLYGSKVLHIKDAVRQTLEEMRSTMSK